MARRAAEETWDRWTLAGPRDDKPWAAGTLADVKDAAAFIEGRAKRPT